MSDPYILGTRGSALALTQSTLAAEHIVQMFNAHSREHGAERTLSFDITTVKTDGDVLTGPLATLGGTGVFAAALRQRLLDGDTPRWSRCCGALAQRLTCRTVPRARHRGNS